MRLVFTLFVMLEYTPGRLKYQRGPKQVIPFSPHNYPQSGEYLRPITPFNTACAGPDSESQFVHIRHETLHRSALVSAGKHIPLRP